MSIFSTLVQWVRTDKSPATCVTDSALQRHLGSDLLFIVFFSFRIANRLQVILR